MPPIPSDLSSFKDYWYALVSALIGTLLGISWTELQTRRRARREAIAKLKRLRASVELNIKLLKVADEQHLAKGTPPNFPFDSSPLGLLIGECYQFLSEKVAAALGWERFQLEHIAMKFAVLNVPIVSKGGHADLKDLGRTGDHIASLLFHVRKTRKQLESILLDIPESPPKPKTLLNRLKSLLCCGWE